MAKKRKPKGPPPPNPFDGPVHEPGDDAPLPERVIMPREERLIQKLTDPEHPITVTRALRESGFHPHSTHMMLRLKPGGDLRARIDEILLAQRASPQRAIRKLANQLEAKETKFFAHEGVVVNTRHVHAHKIQQNAAKEILRLWDAYPKPHDEEVRKRQGPTSVEMVFESEGGETKLGVKISVDGQTPTRGKSDG